MIGCIGFSDLLQQISGKVGQDFPYQFEAVDLSAIIQNPRRFELLVIGPDLQNPVRAVQEVVRHDALLSIVILAGKGDYPRVKQSFQYAPFVGRNTLCAMFTPDTNYAEMFHAAVIRTRQKRSFHRFRSPRESRLSQLTSGSLKMENAGEILEYAPVGALLVNRELEIVGANQASRKLITEINGSGKTYLHNLFYDKDVQTFRSFFVHQQQLQIKAEGMRGNHFEISISNVRKGDDGEALLLLNDVTDRVEQNRRIELILETLPQMAWTADPQGEINFLTQAWNQYTGINASGGFGRGWASIVHPDDLGILEAKWGDSIRRKSVFQQAVRLRRYDGVYRWHLSKSVPVYGKNQEVLMWVGTSTDIHEQVTLTEELERKVRDRTRVLEEMNAELEQFAYISSHDLQEPLRKILTFANIVREESGEELNETSKRYVAKIVDTAHRMTGLIKDLLSFTRVNYAEPVTVVNPEDVFNSIKDDLELLISQTGAEIRIEGELPPLKARPAQLKQLFYNLIINAIKFRKKETNPEIRISCALADAETRRLRGLDVAGEYWDIKVKDNGIGFEQQYADQIFTVFQRLHARSSYEGTGIGLAIARKVVSNHGGEIFAISTPGQGAEFHVLLPREF